VACISAMTVYWMLYNARKGVTSTRLLGATLAVLVQAALIGGAILSLTRPVFVPRIGMRETTLWLPALPRTPPEAKTELRTIDARGSRLPAPSSIIPSPDLIAPAAPPTDLSALGRTLFGCAPEHYAELSPEDRAHCPKPGGELTYQPPDLMIGPSHVKDNVRWANALAHKQSPLELPGGFLFPLALLQAIMDGSVTERSSSFRDPQKWPTYNDPGKLMPRDLHDQERNYDAWHRDHPAQ